MNGIARVLVAATFLVLVACGGGGGGSNDGPGPQQSSQGDFTLSTNTISFNAVQGDPSPAPATLTAHLLDTRPAAFGAAYVAPQVQPSWLTVSITGTAPDFTVTLTPNTSAMAAGNTSVTLTLGTADSSGTTLRARTVQISLIVAPAPVLVAPAAIVLGGANGKSAALASLQFSVSTDATLPWTATTATTSGVNWLGLSATSGQVSAAGSAIDVIGNADALAAGVHTGTITLSAIDQGRTVTRQVSVTLNKERHTLYVPALGAAFSSFPSRQVLTRTLRVTSSYDRTDVPWTAASDQPWLDVTASGTTGGTLVLSVDPSGLADDTVHLATVRVSSPDARIENDQRIRVAFWGNATTDPQPVTLNGVPFELIANPVEPYVYGHTHSDITVYNVYTGASVATFPFAGDAREMTISHDGAVLFVQDYASKAVVALDSATGTELRRYAYAPDDPYGLAYARPEAHPVLILANGNLFDVATGQRFTYAWPNTYFEDNGRIAVHPNGRSVYYSTKQATPARVARYSLRYTALHSDFLRPPTWQASQTFSDVRDMCFDPDGMYLYTADFQGGYNFRRYDALTLEAQMTFPAMAYPNNAECGWNGLFVGAATTGPYAENYWVYAADGTELVHAALNPGFGNAVSAYDLVLSGDNTRLVVPVGNSLAFRELPLP